MAKQNKNKSVPAQRTPNLRVWGAVLLVTVIFLLYGRALNYRYVKLDDASLIVDNYESGFFKNTGNIPQIFRQSCFEIPNHYTDKKSYYRPLLILSFMLDAQVDGAMPGMFHFMNLIYHILATLLLFFFLRKLGMNEATALALSLIFAVHPINVHAVCWVPGRNDILLAIFTLLSFSSLLVYYKDKQPKQLAIHLATFAMALFTKETGVILLPLFLLFMWLWQNDLAFYRRKLFLLPSYLAIIAIWFLLRRSALVGAEEITSLSGAAHTVISNLSYIPLYIGKMLLPFNLNVMPGANTLAVVLGILSLAGLIFLLTGTKDKRKIIFGICWFGFFLGPTLLVPGLPAYEHRAYLIPIGLLMCIGESDYLKNFKFASGKITYAYLVVAVMFAITSYVRIPVYENAFTFWTDATSNTPFAAAGDVNLGKIYQEQYENMHSDGALDKAYTWYRKALDIDSTVKLGNNNFGAVLYFKGQKDLAAQYFMKEIRWHPENADAYQNMAVYYREKGQPASSVPYWQKIVSINKYYITAYEDLIKYYSHAGDTANARIWAEKYSVIKQQLGNRGE